MKSAIIAIALLCRFVDGSVINSNEAESDGGVAVVEWTADDMPDPRYDPESCGISTPGWICDPDGIFTDRAFGGGPEAVDSLNTELWAVANKSECPCLSHDCYTHDVVILVAVVKKLKNPEGKTAAELIGSFAKQLQEDVWKADDTDCQQEIVVAMSVEDEAITTEIGEDILRSKMMLYDDVLMIGGISQSLNDPHDLLGKLKYIVKTYGLYVDHPPLYDDDNITMPIFGPISINRTDSPDTKDSYESLLSPGIISAIVIGVLIFIGAIMIVIAAPAVCRNEKLCLKLKR